MKKISVPLFAFCLLMAGFTKEANAQQRHITKYSSGTGFFVSRQGHLVTNAHVLKKCKKITIQGTGFAPSKAKIVKSDAGLDLAILKANVRPSRIAFLRNPQSTFDVGEKVMVLGYPGDSAKTGKTVVKYSEVKSMRGPTGSKEHLQFNNVSAQGNSGGPIIDFSGNVIGVVMAKATIYRANKTSARNELVGSSDVGISLATLRNYLEDNGIFYYRRDSLMKLSKGRIEKQASNFIVSIMCEQGTTVVNTNDNNAELKIKTLNRQSSR